MFMTIIPTRIFLISLLLITYCITASAVAGQHPFVVEPDWLKARITAPEIMVVDVRSFENYQTFHIKSAVNLPVNDTFGTGENDNLLASLSVIGNLLNQAGIEKDVHIILYDDGKLIDAARLFWVLEVFGHSRVSILNGGLKAWNKEHYPVSRKIIHPIASSFNPAINPAVLATTLSVQLNNSKETHVLIDVRTEEEYEGIKSETDQFGHIPGAVNIPVNRLIDPVTAKLLSQKELIELYQFLNKDTPITVYCNKGKQSALTYFSLRQLGFTVNAYNGSWYEWSKNPLLPREMGNPNKER